MGLRLHTKYCLLFILTFFIGFIVYCCFQSQSEGTVKQNNDEKSFNIRDAYNRKLVEEKKETVDIQPNNIQMKRDFIKKMMVFAFNNYKHYAWGENELRPKSRIGHSTSVFGRAHIGVSIVDAIDTLHIMGLKDEFNTAREWILTSFDMKNAQGELSVFETNIRFVGGLLSTYALTGDEVFLKKAQDVADLLLPAFDTPTGIPMALVNMQTGRGINYGWASGGCSILSEFGSLELEFDYLSLVTNNSIYVEKARSVRKFLDNLKKPNGLYPLYLNPRTGKFCLEHFSVGALGDSFYEYLLKLWIFHDRSDSQIKRVYDDAIVAIENKLLKKSEPSGLWYFMELKGSRAEHKMDHLACFIAGMFALQSKYETDPERKKHSLELGEQIGNTCHEGYVRSVTGIGPETMRFIGESEASTDREAEMYYILRPEVIEGWFVLWRVTGNSKYRDWCWTAAQAIEKYCRTPNGYSGIRNVYTKQPVQDDVQQSFFLSETLKYLYLTFSEPDVISLDDWIFSTEAHPFPIQRVSKA